MKNIYLFLFIATLHALSCKESDKDSCSNEVSRVNEKAQKAKSRIDSLSLLKELEKTISEQPDCIELHFFQGNVLMALNNLSESKKAFSRTFIFDTVSVLPLYKLGLIFQAENNYDSSIYFLSKALYKKSYGKAIIDFNKLEGVEEGHNIGRYDVPGIEIIYHLAISHYYKHSLLAALKYFNACIDKGYMIGNSYLYRGSINLELNKKDEACTDFNSAKQEGMSEAEVYLNKYCGTATSTNFTQ